MRNSVRTILLLLGDLLALMAAFWAMLEAAFPGRISEDIFDSHFEPFLYVFLVWIFIFFLFNLYETASAKPTIPQLKKVGLAFLTALSLSLILFYIMPDFGITPKTNLIIFSGVFVLLFLVWRRIFYSIFAVYFQKSVALIVDTEKDSPRVNELLNYMETYPQSGFFVLGTYPSFEEFRKINKAKKIDALIISKNVPMKGENLKSIYSSIEDIFDLAYACEYMLGKIPVDSIDETWFLHNIRSADKTFYDIISKVVNIFAAFAFLVLALPFLLIVALLIKLEDGGPIFYIQGRVGKNDKNFSFYKFRSMVINADQNGAEWTEKNDPRITKVGKIIRRLHIDEIPQLWNILKGDMSLVGPRPELPTFAEKLERGIPHYNLRHIIKPGFTGWAQIKYRNARGIAESKEKFEYDLYYIKNRNIFMDFGIILRTIVIIFTHD